MIPLQVCLSATGTFIFSRKKEHFPPVTLTFDMTLTY